MAKSRKNDCEDIRLELQAAQARIAELERENQTLAADMQQVYGVLDTMPEILVRFDTDYTVRFANQAFATLHGKATPPDIVGLNLLDTVTAEERVMIQEQVALLKPGQSNRLNISRNYDATGKEYWIEWTDLVLQDEQGAVIGYQSIGRDVTARYELQMELERNTAILDQAQDIIALSDLKGYLLYVNEAGARILGYDSPAELMGVHVSSLQADAEAVAYLRDVIVPSMKQTQWRGETRLRKRDGTVIDVEQTAFAIRHADQPVYLATIVRDITQKKRIEAELKRSEDRFARIFATIPYAVAILRSSDLVIREINDKFVTMYGCNREEVIGRNPNDCVMLSRSINFEQLRHQMQESGSIVDSELEFKDQAGATRHGLLSATVLNFDGEAHMLVAIQDVTHIRTLQAREEAMVGYLRGVVRVADELIPIEDDAMFEQRVVELMRERFGVERAALFLGDEKREKLNGTFGTDPHGNTIDEHDVSLPGFMLADLDKLESPWYLIEDTALSYWDGREVQQCGRGWLAATFIRSVDHVIGIINYDSAITGAAFDPVRQEAIVIYASLLGNIIRRRRTEKELRAADQRYRVIVENSNAAIVQMDVDGVFLYANERAATYYGYSVAELVGRNILDLYPPDQLKVVLNGLNRILETGESVHYEGAGHGALAGHTYSSVIYPLLDVDGKVTSLMLNALDITPVRAAESALREAQERYRTIVETAQEGIMIGDSSGVISYVNQHCCQLLGLDADQLINKSLGMFVRSKHNVMEGGLQILVEQNKLAYYLQRRLAGISDRYDLQIRRPDNTERWISVAATPLRDMSGEITGFLSMYTDITDRKRVEAAQQAMLDELERRVQERTAQLESERTLLRTVIDSIPDMIFVKDLERRYIICNQTTASVFGMDNPDAVLGKTARDVIPLEYALGFEKTEDELIAGRDSIRNLSLHTPFLGEEFEWSLTNIVPLRSKNQDLIGLVGLTRSITEQKRAQATLERKYEEEQQLRAYLRMLHEIMIEMTEIDDLDQLYRYIVESAVSRLEYERFGLFLYDKEQNCATCTYGVDTNGQVVSAYDLQLPLKDDELLFHTLKDPTHFFMRDGEILHGTGEVVGIGTSAAVALVHADEILGWITVDNLLRLQPLSTLRLEVLAQYAVLIASVLVRKQTEQALRESEAKYRQLLDRTGGAVAMFDAEWNLTYINDRFCEISGYRREELMGMGYWRMLDPERQRIMLDTRQDRSRGESTTYELQLIHKDGSPRTLLVNGTPLLDRNGLPAGSFSISVDITAQKHAEDALRRALQREQELGSLKTQFVSTTSHEFRTPLAVINAVTETLLKYRDRLAPDQVDERLQKIRGQVAHLRQIMDGVLQLAKIQAGRMDFKPEIGDLGLLCVAVIEEINTMLEAEDRIHYHAPTESIEMVFDRRLMRQILINLLSNALKYSAEDQPVEFTLERMDDAVMLRVQDHGIGIPAANLPNIFEPFHRASNVGTIPGTGLGMPIVKESVQLHNGTISLDSEEGYGTLVTIVMPLTLEIPEAHGETDDLSGETGLLVE
jgi:PAS domain S-box-containing protein